MSDVGYATLPVIPSMRGARGVIERELNGEAGAAGDTAGREFGNRFESSSKGPLSRVGSLIGGIAKGTGIVALSALAAGAALAGFGIKGAADLEQTTTAFTSLLGSSKAATDEIKALQKYAAATPFSQTDVIGYAQQFFSLANSIGLSKAQVIPFLDAIGNLGAVTGASTQNIHNAVMAIGQIGSSGKVTLDNLNQISEAFPGFNGAAAIASATGQTTAQVMKQIGAGSLDAKTGVQALLVGMQKFPGAAGAMQKQSLTLKGLWSTFTDTLSIQLTKAFQPVLPVLKKTLAQLTPIIGNAVKDLAPAIAQFITVLAPIIGPLIKSLGSTLKAVFAALGPALAALTPLIAPLTQTFVSLAQSTGPWITLMAKFITVLAPPLLGILRALGPALGPIIIAWAAYAAVAKTVAIAQALMNLAFLANPVVFIVAAVVALGAALVLAYKHSTTFRNAVQDTLNVLKLLLGPIIAVAKALGGPLIDALKDVVGWIGNALDRLHELTGGLRDLLGITGPTIDGHGSLSPALQEIADRLAGVRLASSGALGGLLAVAGAATGLGGILGAAAAGANAVTDALFRMATQAAFAAAALIPVVGPALGLAGAALSLPKVPKASPAGAFTVPKNAGGGAAAAAKTLPSFDQGTLTSFLSSVGITSNPLTDALNAIFKSAAASGQRIGAPLANALRAENSQLKGMVSQRESIAKALDAAQAKLQAARDSYNNEKSTVKSAVTGTFDVSGVQSAFGEPVTLFDIQGALATAVRNARAFTSVLKRLAKEGLAKGLLQQLAMAGPGALTQAQALLSATPKQLAEINSSYKALGDQGTALGKFMADDLYGAGVNAADGLVKGLKSKQSALTKAIKSLAEAMVAQLRSSLDMHSPSRRLFNEGALAFEGYRLGIESKGREIEKDLGRLGNRLMPASKIQASHRVAESGRGDQHITINQEIHNPIPEAPSRTTPASIRRAAYGLRK